MIEALVDGRPNKVLQRIIGLNEIELFSQQNINFISISKKKNLFRNIFIYPFHPISRF